MLRVKTWELGAALSQHGSSAYWAGRWEELDSVPGEPWVAGGREAAGDCVLAEWGAGTGLGWTRSPCSASAEYYCQPIRYRNKKINLTSF